MQAAVNNQVARMICDRNFTFRRLFYAHIIRKHDIAENVVRRLLTYGIGRELNYRDRYEVKKILSQCKENDFLFQDMIIAICQSSTFRGATNKK